MHDCKETLNNQHLGLHRSSDRQYLGFLCFCLSYGRDGMIKAWRVHDNGALSRDVIGSAGGANQAEKMVPCVPYVT
eukprot:1159905-Pelagomonas_calceolata.AAC.6